MIPDLSVSARHPGPGLIHFYDKKKHQVGCGYRQAYTPQGVSSAILSRSEAATTRARTYPFSRFKSRRWLALSLSISCLTRWGREGTPKQGDEQLGQIDIKQGDSAEKGERRRRSVEATCPVVRSKGLLSCLTYPSRK